MMRKFVMKFLLPSLAFGLLFVALWPVMAWLHKHPDFVPFAIVCLAVLIPAMIITEKIRDRLDRCRHNHRHHH